jgi:SAM-dependent methyltransferase
MILRALHRVASQGPVYDWIQELAGIRLIHRHFAAALSFCRPYSTVLDVGGGTGRVRNLLSPDCRYFCLDNEPPKLLQLRKRIAGALPILGDATMTPVVSGSMDLVLCLAVSHHLNDAEFERMVAEAARALTPAGHLLFYDALWKPRWLPGRLIWSLDRGSHPRPKQALVDVVQRHMRIAYQDEFRLGHEYLLLVGAKNAA